MWTVSPTSTHHRTKFLSAFVEERYSKNKNKKEKVSC
jgi:hypothetical protein